MSCNKICIFLYNIKPIKNKIYVGRKKGMKGCLYAGKCLLMRTSLGAEDSKQEINKKVKKSKKQNQSLRPKEEEMKSRKRESTVNREEFHFNILSNTI